MKKLYLIITVLFISVLTLGQVPKAFKYQAVVRDTSGTVIADQLVSLKISILKGSIEGQVVYTEIHDVNTNKLGLVNLEIGRGLATTGNFSEISWGNDSYFIKIELDITGGMNYTFMGTSQLLSVPYALYAETAGNQGSSGDSYWKPTIGGIYYNEGNVGIGTINPSSNLHILGSSVGTGNRRFLQISNASTDNYSCSVLGINAGTGTSGTSLSHHASSYNLYGGKYAQTTLLSNEGLGLFFRTKPIGNFIFETWDGGQYNDPVELMRITGDGNVGIGTENPVVPLQIEGTSENTSNRVFMLLKNNSLDDFSCASLRLVAGNGTGSTYLTQHSDTYTIFGEEYANTTCLWNYNGKGLLLAATTGGKIVFEIANADKRSFTEYMRMTDNGNFGIGLKYPQRPLHVNDVMRLEPRYTPPDNPGEGDIYMDGNSHKLKVYDGTTWQSCW